MVRSVGLGLPERCFLYQNVDAAPYRGKVLVFGLLRGSREPAWHGWWFRVHQPDNSSSFFDNLGDHPVQSAQWDAYQIVFPIDDEARDIEFGIQLYGEGAASIDQIYMGSPILEAEKEINQLFRKFNVARDVVDGHAMAETSSETGEYISAWGRTLWDAPIPTRFGQRIGQGQTDDPKNRRTHARNGCRARDGRVRELGRTDRRFPGRCARPLPKESGLLSGGGRRR